jgi:uncharacterized protein
MMRMKVTYFPYVWIAFFLVVLGGVLLLHKSFDPFAKGEFGGVQVAIEYARTPAEREQGLSGRTEIPENYGMLFVFEKPSTYAFWMKDMQVPIDIFWLDENKNVLYFFENALPEKYPETYAPSEPALYVLETRAGFAKANNISVGATLSVQDFSLGKKSFSIPTFLHMFPALSR